MQPSDSSYNVPPFPAFPSTSRYVPLGPVQDSLGRVCRSIDASEAISLVIGPPGTGKSLIGGLLCEHYRESHDVVVIGETCLDDRAAFMRHLLHALNVEISAVPDGDLQLALVDYACGDESSEGGLLIVIDEAQSLSAEVLEAIRMTTNINRDGEPRVSAVLCGGVKLDETLSDAALESFTQRVATRCYLHPLNADETRRYVTETIRNCGAESEETITDKAITSVHHACSGVPRLINQMMTQAIDCAEDADQSQITEQIIDCAWAQLQQLPSPMVEEPRITQDSAPVEFGELDESVEFGGLSDCVDSPCDESAPVGSLQEEVSSDAVQDEFIEVEKSDTDESVFTGCEIEIESSTAQWIDETESTGIESNDEVEIPVALVESPVQLFGHFDDEEEVALGNGVVARDSRAPATPPANLEAMLHQEIVGMSTYCDDSESPEEQPLVTDQLEELGVIEETPEVHGDFIEIEDEGSAVLSVEPKSAALWVEGGSNVTDGGDDLIHDDCDILVIEDEVELRRPAARLDSKDQTISVDFQAMLSRMRSGS